MFEKIRLIQTELGISKKKEELLSKKLEITEIKVTEKLCEMSENEVVKKQRILVDSFCEFDVSKNEMENRIRDFEFENQHWRQKLELKEVQLQKTKKQLGKKTSIELELKIELSKARESGQTQNRIIRELNQEQTDLKNRMVKWQESQKSDKIEILTETKDASFEIRNLKNGQLAQLKQLKIYEDELKKNYLAQNEKSVAENLELAFAISAETKNNEKLRRRIGEFEEKEIRVADLEIKIRDLENQNEKLRQKNEEENAICATHKNLAEKIESFKNANEKLSKQIHENQLFAIEKEKAVQELSAVKRQLQEFKFLAEGNSKEKTEVINSLLGIFKETEMLKKQSQVNLFKSEFPKTETLELVKMEANDKAVENSLANFNNQQIGNKPVLSSLGKIENRTIGLQSCSLQTSTSKNASFPSSHSRVNITSTRDQKWDGARIIQVRSQSRPVQLKNPVYLETTPAWKGDSLPVTITRVIGQLNPTKGVFASSNVLDEKMVSAHSSQTYKFKENLEEPVGFTDTLRLGVGDQRRSTPRDFGEHTNCTRFKCICANQYRV